VCEREKEENGQYGNVGVWPWSAKKWRVKVFRLCHPQKKGGKH